jgi:S1-C subfamily serine protease
MRQNMLRIVHFVTIVVAISPKVLAVESIPVNHPSVVVIFSIELNLPYKERVLGANVLLSEDGRILTAEHVIPPGRHVYVGFPGSGSSQIMARVNAHNKRYDLGLLKLISPFNLPDPGRLGLSHELRELLAKGQSVSVSGTGHPFVGRSTELFNSFDTKILRVVDGFFVINQQFYGGHGGGPLWNEAGEVIAILSKAKTSQVGEDLAISIEYAHEFLTSAALDSNERRVQSYRSQIGSLTGRIIRLNKRIERYNKPINKHFTYLHWSIKIRRDDDSSLG